MEKAEFESLRSLLAWRMGKPKGGGGRGGCRQEWSGDCLCHPHWDIWEERPGGDEGQ